MIIICCITSKIYKYVSMIRKDIKNGKFALCKIQKCVEVKDVNIYDVI